MHTPFLLCSLAAPLLAAAQPGAEPPAPLVPYPHPLITEILYAVPTGAAGDANKDGVRDTSGDEFIELTNPHDKPIALRGYTLTGKAPEAPAPGKTYKILKFVFPPLELDPGEVVVVFNGHGAAWKGPVGDTVRAAYGGDEAFSGARVFSMKIESARMGLANKADYVLLTAPGGQAVQCVAWGDINPPEGVPLMERAPSVSGQSVARRDAGDPLEGHPPIDGIRYSPGRFPIDRPEPKAPDSSGPSGSPGAPASPGTPRKPGVAR